MSWASVEMTPARPGTSKFRAIDSSHGDQADARQKKRAASERLSQVLTGRRQTEWTGATRNPDDWTTKLTPVKLKDWLMAPEESLKQASRIRRLRPVSEQSVSA